MKQAIIGILVVMGIIGGAVIFGKTDEVAGTPSNNFYGQEQSTVTLVEYGDFECPACAAFFPIVTQVKEQFKDQIRFEFRHFPLAQIHGNATAAHRAAEAAAKQGKFWEMHDLLYQRQASWRTSNSGAVGHNGVPIYNDNPSLVFEGYATELGLDLDQYKADVRVSTNLATINADIDRGKADEVSGTPTFVLNGKKIEDSSSIDTVEKFAALIEQVLADAAPAEDQTNIETTKPEDSEVDTTETTEAQ